MRDKKISILLFVSFLLLLASFLILCTWVYNYYTKEEKLVSKPVTSNARSEVTRDSLLKIYTHTIQELESQLGTTYSKTDSLESSLSLKLDGYYKLKDELAALLKKPTSNDDFKLAKIKITELQKKIDELRAASKDIEAENSRLYTLLEQYNRERRGGQSIQYIETSQPVSAVTQSGSSTSAPTSNPPGAKIEMPEKTAAPFSSNELSLAAFTEENEVQDGFNTNRKILGSFALTHSVDMYNSEVMIIILYPNGQVMQKSAWESGSFQTHDGKKIYSLKMNVNYTRGEAKKLTFSIVTDKFVGGNYTMQIYNNGILIGRLAKVLS